MPLLGCQSLVWRMTSRLIFAGKILSKSDPHFGYSDLWLILLPFSFSIQIQVSASNQKHHHLALYIDVKSYGTELRSPFYLRG